jgi:hypothetical protein
MIEMIFSLYEICSILLNIVIPYGWNKFVSHVKSLIIIISQMARSQNLCITYIKRPKVLVWAFVFLK